MFFTKTKTLTCSKTFNYGFTPMMGLLKETFLATGSLRVSNYKIETTAQSVIAHLIVYIKAKLLVRKLYSELPNWRVCLEVCCI